MDKRFNCIVEYLEKKKSEKFSGSTKLSFEGGCIVAINEANKHDLPMSNISDVETVETLLNKIDHSFNGAIMFVYDRGDITQYAYSNSYKGETLRKFLGSSYAEMSKMR